MAQNKNLLDLDQKPISYYIITTSEETIKQLDDSGSIIIRASHNGEPLGFEKQLNELEGTTYNSLYIGDEHIATGFGFSNISTRSYVLDMAYNVVPDLINRLDRLEYGTKSDEEQIDSDSTFNLDSEHRYIKTTDNEYALNWDASSKTLSVVSSVKESLFNPCLFQKFVNPITGEEYWNQLSSEDIFEIGDDTVSAIFSYLTFEYIGDESVSKIYFDYSTETSTSKTENTLFNEDLCGSRTNPFDIDTENEYFTITKQYVVKDPDLNPETLQEKWRIDFKGKFGLLITEKQLHEQNGIFNLKLNIILGTRKLSIVFITLSFAPSVFYSIGLNDFNGYIGEGINISKLPIMGDKRKYNVTFQYNNTVVPEYNVFYIPTKIMDRVIDQRGENGPKMILESSNITFPWICESTTNFLLKHNKQVQYYVFRSPYKYLGPAVNWILEI